MKVRITDKYSNFYDQSGTVVADDRATDGSVLVDLGTHTTWFWEDEYMDISPETPDLMSIIEDIESKYFRTNSDTGANKNALFVWNALRKAAGLPSLTADDLRQRQVDSSSEPGLTVEKLRGFDEWRKDYSLWHSHGMNQSKYDAIAAKGGYKYLLERLDTLTEASNADD